MKNLQASIENLLSLSCPTQIKIKDARSIPKEAEPLLAEAYLDPEELRKKISELQNNQVELQNLLRRRNNFFHDWLRGSRLPEPSSNPKTLLTDSREDIEALWKKCCEIEETIHTLLERERYPEGRPCSWEALGNYKNETIILHSTVIKKASEEYGYPLESLEHLALTHFTIRAVAHQGLDADGNSWHPQGWNQGELLSTLALYFSDLYIERFAPQLTTTLKQWLAQCQIDISDYLYLANYSREVIKSSFIFLRKLPHICPFTDFQKIVHDVNKLNS